eukprot:gene878-102_t
MPPKKNTVEKTIKKVSTPRQTGGAKTQVVWVGTYDFWNPYEGGDHNFETYVFSTRKAAERHAVRKFDGEIDTEWRHGLHGFGKEQEEVRLSVQIKVEDSFTGFYVDTLDNNEGEQFSYEVKKHTIDDDAATGIVLPETLVNVSVEPPPFKSTREAKTCWRHGRGWIQLAASGVAGRLGRDDQNLKRVRKPS